MNLAGSAKMVPRQPSRLRLLSSFTLTNHVHLSHTWGEAGTGLSKVVAFKGTWFKIQNPCLTVTLIWNLGLLKLYDCISLQVLIHAAYAIWGVGYSIQMMNNRVRTPTFCLPAVCHDHSESLLRSVLVSDVINFQQNSIWYKLSVIDYPLRSHIHRESPGSSLSRTWAQCWMQPPGHQ